MWTLVKIKKVIVKADDKLLVHIILSVEIRYTKFSNIYKSHALVIGRARRITEKVTMHIIIDVAFDLYRKTRLQRMLMVAPSSKIYLTTAGKMYLVYSETFLVRATGAHC